MNTDEDSAMMDFEMSSTSTTIDPSVVQSRIRQSISLQKEQAAIDMDTSTNQPVFPQLSATQANGNKVEYRRVRCPAHRYTPLREYWEQILTPLVEYLKLQVRRIKYFLCRFCSWRQIPNTGMCSVLFLELQTLQEASLLLWTIRGHHTRQSDAILD